MKIQLVTVPYRYDEPNEGLGLGPGALLDAGVAERIAQAGHEVLNPVHAFLDPALREEGRTAVNIGKLGSDTARLVSEARASDAAAFVLAGDDTATVGVVAGLQRMDGPAARLGIVWVDAHGDFNTPETSYSGILAGMPLAVIAGLAGPLWREAAGLVAPIPTDRIIIAGARDLDEKEEALLRSTGVRLFTTVDLRERTQFAESVQRFAQQVDALLLQVDLDVLDPHLVPSASTPSADGLEIPDAVLAMTTVLETGKVASVCITSLNPGGGQRGHRSIESALRLIEDALAHWSSAPSGRQS